MELVALIDKRAPYPARARLNATNLSTSAALKEYSCFQSLHTSHVDRGQVNPQAKLKKTRPGLHIGKSHVVNKICSHTNSETRIISSDLGSVRREGFSLANPEPLRISLSNLNDSQTLSIVNSNLIVLAVVSWFQLSEVSSPGPNLYHASLLKEHVEYDQGCSQ